ncbi:hypothetical protein [Streptomyces sp. NBC_01237]|uniref:hypothetical protein n=1 Tax=Streptomyces sp. NBC_01237 TaxID=2903790 RepID=UPI002DD9F38D|nr:hypothetical protein [Streptomyces sp. NBC_01237]WRZ78253.1 hypothetical protein OG251_42575 [Streptomyces sp. NBC_01237]
MAEAPPRINALIADAAGPNGPETDDQDRAHVRQGRRRGRRRQRGRPRQATDYQDPDETPDAVATTTKALAACKQPSGQHES